MPFKSNPEVGIDEYKIHIKVVGSATLELYKDVNHQIPLGPDPSFPVAQDSACILKFYVDHNDWEFADPPIDWGGAGKPQHIHEHKISPDRKCLSILDLNHVRLELTQTEETTSFTLQVQGVSNPSILLKKDPTIVDKGEQGGNGWVR